VSLLHILDLHRKNQINGRSGRATYDIKLLHISTSCPEEGSKCQNLARKVANRYPNYEISVISLSDVFEDSSIFAILDSTTLKKNDNFHHSQDDNERRLTDLLHTLPSTTARSDVVEQLRKRLVVNYAKKHKCEAILWGDCTTRLAERTLSETAKGRGFSIASQLAEDESPFDILFHFPMRDLLKKELVAYTSVVQPELTPLILPVAPQQNIITRNTTVDDLMKQYFESVEESYPGVVTNVVRTTEKLVAPPLAKEHVACSLCLMPVFDGRFGIHGWGGDQANQTEAGAHSSQTTETPQLCYGCSRSCPRMPDVLYKT
jgi:cytoplasmic tRNA 2-thiolation protein 2